MREKLTAEKLFSDPIEQFRHWYSQAYEDAKSHDVEPNAMSLATCSKAGTPSVRTVLLKDFDSSGFVFFTNYLSRKGRELSENPQAALLFYWPYSARQVRIEGGVHRLSTADSDAYFQSRSRHSRIGALASSQSQPIHSRRELITRFRQIQSRMRGKTIRRPEHWGGFVLQPAAMEFWQAGAHRLHDRFRYEKAADQWRIHRLAP